MKPPKRKVMRWDKHCYSGNGAYFITICTKDRKCILSKIQTVSCADRAFGTEEIGAIVEDVRYDISFGKSDVPKTILTEKGRIVEKYILSSEKMQGVRIVKYVIMPNHIHLLISVHDQSGTSRAPSPTNEVIPRLVAVFKRLCNREIGEDVFQRSYYDRVIRDDKEYAEVETYIRTNPLRWRDDHLYSQEY